MNGVRRFALPGHIQPASGASTLDGLNRADRPIGSNWSGRASGYAISSHQLLATGAVEYILWNPASFEADQEASFTLTSINHKLLRR